MHSRMATRRRLGIRRARRRSGTLAFTPQVHCFPGGSGVSDFLLTSSAEQPSSPWDALETELRKWQENPDAVFEPSDQPTSDAFETAMRVVEDLREDFPAPSSVTPTGDGQIVFEWRTGDAVELLETAGLNRLELTSIRDGVATEVDSFELPLAFA